MTALMAALAGANLIYGAGMTESGVTFDYAQYVLDNEIATMVKRAVGGIPGERREPGRRRHPQGGVVRPLPGAPVDAQARSRAQPAAAPRPPRTRGLGGRGLRGRLRAAKAEAKRILEEYQPEPLSSDVADEVQAILHETEKERGVA